MKKRGIIIELTSLLDVILIMIFVLLTQAKAQTGKALDEAAAESERAQQIEQELKQAEGKLQEQIRRAEDASREAELREEELQAEIGKLSEEACSLKRLLTSRNLVTENSVILTISENGEHRIRLQEEEMTLADIPYDWNDESYAYNSLRSLLLGKLRDMDGKTMFLVFQYDRSKIYTNEYHMIIRVFQELKLEASLKEIPISFIEWDEGK